MQQFLINLDAGLVAEGENPLTDTRDYIVTWMDSDSSDPAVDTVPDDVQLSDIEQYLTNNLDLREALVGADEGGNDKATALKEMLLSERALTVPRTEWDGFVDSIAGAIGATHQTGLKDLGKTSIIPTMKEKYNIDRYPSLNQIRVMREWISGGRV